MLNSNISIIEYVLATKESSQRVRNILFSSIVISVILFSATWNVRSGNWLEHYRDRIKQLIVENEQEMKMSKARLSIEERKGYADSSSEKLQNYHAMYLMCQEKILSNSQIAAPLIGIPFHVNDLALIGGFTLIVLIYLLKKSVSLEYKSISELLCLARENKVLKDVYTLVSMYQILIPAQPIQSQRNENKRGCINIGSFLVYIPALALAYVIYADLISYERIASEPYMPMICLLSLEICFLGILLILAMICRWHSIRIETMLNSAYEEATARPE